MISILGRGVGLLPLVFLFLPLDIALAQHFQNCRTSVNNATVFVPDSADVTIGDSAALQPGDEIAVVTPEGECAGMATWDGSTTVISAAQGDELNEYAGGFEPGEVIQYRIWDASAQQEYDGESGSVSYFACEQVGLCSSDDGLFRTDAFMHVSKLAVPDAFPVEWAAIGARAKGKKVLVEWRTASEVDNAGFDVQHQKGGSDTWTTLGFVEGHGTTSAPEEYSYETQELSVGTHRFRLKQVDYEGHFTISESVEVTIELTGDYELSPAYPNPFQHRTRVSLTVAEAQAVTVAVYNTLGQQIAILHDGQLAANKPYRFKVDGQWLSSGLYFIQIRGASFHAVRRIALVR